MIKKVTVQLILLSLFNVVVYSQNGVVNIDTIYFNIDINKRIILVNRNVGELNSSYSESKNSILSNGANYTLITPVSEFEIGTTYKVSDIQGEYSDLYFTQLPIINITSNNTIVNEPSVHAHFSMCESDGNFIENAIGIEYRGGWTQTLSKKSFKIEFWNDTSGNNTEDFSLLEMRSDDDWNIQAMYNEPLRLRSKVNFELWREIDTLYYTEDEPKATNGVTQEYVELFVNKEYRGLYALSERVDRKQLQLEKFKNGEIRGELYKGVSWGASTFTSLPQYDNNSEVWSGFEYEYPDDEINWTNIYELVDFVINEDSITFYENYQDKFKIDNAVNYFIFLNLLRATDNTGKNIFIARYNNDEPYFYIPWDLEGTFGMIWNGTKENITDDILTNGFYKRLILDNEENGFLEKLKRRWNELRHYIISVESIIEAFNTQFHYLKANGVYERELKAWSDCEFFDYNNIEYTYEWLENRLNYLDNIFNNPELLTSIQEDKLIEKIRFRIFPNPASIYLYFDVASDNSMIEKISVLNYLGHPLRTNFTIKNNGRIDISDLNDGVYLIVADFRDGFRQVEKLIIKK